MQAYQKALPEIRSAGGSLVAVSPQTPDNSLSTAEKSRLDFEVLSDPGNRVARLYRLVFPLVEELRDLFLRVPKIDLARYNGDDSWELPMPGTFVIDRDSRIRLAFVDADYTRRLEPAAIIEKLREIHTPG